MSVRAGRIAWATCIRSKCWRMPRWP